MKRILGWTLLALACSACADDSEVTTEGDSTGNERGTSSGGDQPPGSTGGDDDDDDDDVEPGTSSDGGGSAGTTEGIPDDDDDEPGTTGSQEATTTGSEDGDTSTTGTEQEETGDTGGRESGETETGEPGETETGEPGETDTGGRPLNACTHACEVDADCILAGMDFGLECIGGLCNVGCDDDLQCQATISFGFGSSTCESLDDCGPQSQCVNGYDGEFHCALSPTEVNPCPDAPGYGPIPAVDIEGNDVAVCGYADASCDPDLDEEPVCTLFIDCNEEPDACGLMDCMPDGGCQCTSDEQCGEPTACDLDSGRCVLPCEDEIECAEFLPYEGGTLTCEAPDFD